MEPFGGMNLDEEIAKHSHRKRKQAKRDLRKKERTTGEDEEEQGYSHRYPYPHSGPYQAPASPTRLCKGAARSVQNTSPSPVRMIM